LIPLDIPGRFIFGRPLVLGIDGGLVGTLHTLRGWTKGRKARRQMGKHKTLKGDFPVSPISLFSRYFAPGVRYLCFREISRFRMFRLCETF
jgi:hypothetical protein